MTYRIPLLLGCALVAPAYANIELSDNISLSGFGSTSWAKSDNDTPLLLHRDIEDTSCFDCDTIFGLQLDMYHEGFHASAQVVKRPQDNWNNPELEWAYLAYSHENWQVHLGRLRNPLFLYSEYYYVGQAYTPARPPSEVYNSILGITYFEGGSFTWTQEFGEQYTLDITPFFGLKDDRKIQYNDMTTVDVKTHEMFGMNLSLSADNYRWNFAYLKSKYDNIIRISDLPDPIVVDKNSTIELFSLGAEYDFDNLTLTAEAQKNDRLWSWYAMAAHRFGHWTPYISYAQQYNANDDLDGDSLLLGTRYDISYNVSINAEWHYVSTEKDGEGLFVTLPQDEQANLYTVMLNFVF